ncbi:MAG TPA: hypothetical protein V6D12_00660 [Candidatus Obscuribacterales bacterium]
MASPVPLKDLELIDCAKANAKQGVETAAELCGYGQDINTFQRELKTACDRIGVQFNGMSDLITDQQDLLQLGGEIVAPDSESEL